LKTLSRVSCQFTNLALSTAILSQAAR